MADVTADAVENDEPQFKVGSEDKAVTPKAGKAKGVIVLTLALVAVIFGLVFFADLVFNKNSSPSIKNPGSITKLVEPDIRSSESLSDSDPYANEFVVVGDKVPVVDGAAPLSVSISDPAVQQPAAQSSQSLNLALVNKLSDLNRMLEELNGQVGSLKGQLLTVQRELGQQTLAVQRTLDGVSATLELASQGDANREKLIRMVLADVNGFQKGLNDDRQKFTFKILHDEFYGGKPRIVGYVENRPQNVIKLYIGDEVGMWRLVDIKDGFAVFQHIDGQEHKEKLS